MFIINPDKSVHITRGDVGIIDVSATLSEGGNYLFKVGDVVRFKVFEKNHCERVIFEKDVIVDVEAEVISVQLLSADTRIGEVINKPKDYWYEVELNPETHPQTIVGYDISGPKVFRLYPEGDDN